ncbi:MAG TPA: ferritin-like domain-containing protein [Vicinamibacteria bacterium]|nr:ferritin-like domain-containing protein [Vicinamibacteria bacterium]
MDPSRFVDEIEATLWQLLSVRDAVLSRLGESVRHADMPLLLKGALRNEMEAADIAARWMPVTPEIEAKIAFARQAGDEARHYQLIASRLEAMGVDLAGWSPLADGPSRLFRHLETLESTVERVAAAQFTREAIGYKANELFIAFCEACGDAETARLYREEIQPEELHHHQWGGRLLRALARTDDQQAAARQAVLSTLERAEELRALAAGRLLVEALPGC